MPAKNPGGNPTPDTTQAVDGPGSDHIIKPELLQKTCPQNNQDTSHQANDYGFNVRYGITTGRDANQASQNAI